MAENKINGMTKVKMQQMFGILVISQTIVQSL